MLPSHSCVLKWKEIRTIKEELSSFGNGVLQLLIAATDSMRRVIRRQDNGFIGIVRNVKVKNCNVTRYDFSL